MSEGFTTTVPPQLNDHVAAMPGVGNGARGLVRQDRSRRRESADGRQGAHMSLIYTEINRNNTSIYAVDPRGLAAFDTTSTRGDRPPGGSGSTSKPSLDTLRALADNTDGRAIVNTNDLGKGMRQIIRDASGYYLIGYNSSQAPTDGPVSQDRRRRHAQGR